MSSGNCLNVSFFHLLPTGEMILNFGKVPQSVKQRCYVPKPGMKQYHFSTKPSKLIVGKP